MRRGWVAIVGAIGAALGLGSGCFDPNFDNNFDTDTESGTSSGSGATMTSMTLTSPDSTGDADTTLEPDSGSTGPGPECSSDAECASMASECEVATCGADGTCAVANAEEGAACGNEKSGDCDAADTCDGNGQCRTNVAPDGTDCSECPTGQCTCSGGSCDECVLFADTNLFTTDRALAGWTLTGDWGLYSAAPISDGGASPAVSFGNRVLGTDGNRHFPYPGAHAERSYARTPPTELPTELQFQSWHVDEGAASYDNKIIRISTDGGATWEDIISCPLDPELPFCQSVAIREPDDWDMISLTLPAPLVGQVGIIEFTYDTFDACCGFEKGWYIDVTNFATECQCTTDATCAPYGSDCGVGACGGNGGCNLEQAAAAGTACGDATDDACTSPDTCDGAGYCQPNHVLPESFNAAVECDSCAGGACVGCAGGICEDCPNLPELQTFDSIFFAGWVPPDSVWTPEATSGGGFATFFQIPASENGSPALLPERAPFYGLDGNIAGAADGVGEVNTASTTSPPVVFGATLEFASWHQDFGGTSGSDLKVIELSIDDGVSWMPLADCGGAAPLNAFPFCQQVTTREADDWDDISLDVSAYMGMEGVVRFSYDTVNPCCGNDRGWYIDDLNFAQTCAAPNTSLSSECQFQLAEDPCNENTICAWDASTSECFDCLQFGFNEGEKGCDANPLCEWRPAAGGAGGQPICAQAISR